MKEKHTKLEYELMSLSNNSFQPIDLIMGTDLTRVGTLSDAITARLENINDENLWAHDLLTRSVVRVGHYMVGVEIADLRQCYYNITEIKESESKKIKLKDDKPHHYNSIFGEMGSFEHSYLIEHGNDILIKTKFVKCLYQNFEEGSKKYYKILRDKGLSDINALNAMIPKGVGERVERRTVKVLSLPGIKGNEVDECILITS